MINIIITAAVVMGGLGLVLGAVIGFVAKKFKVQSDPRIDLVLELLPGANCGGCGKAGCADFAKSVVSGENQPNRCPVSSRETVSQIAALLGVDAGESFPKKAVVLCGGGSDKTVNSVHYNGITDCASAALINGGPKACLYGCLGMGSCARRCPFGAIEIVNNLAVVHPEICVGCGKCAEVCPRGVIKLVPANAPAHVYCNSKIKGAEKRNYCEAGCIGCRKCERYAADKFSIEGFLARVRYDAATLPDANDVTTIGCPKGTLLTEVARLAAAKQQKEAR